jgi:hypothetical protein
VRVDHVIWVAHDLHPTGDRLAREYRLPDGGSASR